MLTTHTQVVQISIAYTTRIQLLLNDKVMYETSLIMEGRFQCIFGTVLFVTRRETAVIIVFVDGPLFEMISTVLPSDLSRSVMP